MNSELSASSDIRARTLRLVLHALREETALSRADLAMRTRLSKPTVAAALRTFEEAGILREFGRTTGRRGPSASLYSLVADALPVLGVDIGPRCVRAAVADLAGRTLGEFELPVDRPAAERVLALVAELGELVREAAPRTQLAVVGLPGAIDPRTGRISAAPTIERWDGLVAEAVLGDALGLPVQIENDVNLAALGEQAAGAGRGVQNFAYVSIGTGLGAGIVLNGSLHRGARGAAGEIGFIPLGTEPDGAAGGSVRAAMEERLSTQGLMQNAERLSPLLPGTALPDSVPALFDAARRGNPLAQTVVRDTASEIAACIATLTAVLDLELVLLGGGIGGNGDVLLAEVEQTLRRLVPTPPRVECAQLDDRAVLTGAIALGLEAAGPATIRRLVAPVAAEAAN